MAGAAKKRSKQEHQADGGNGSERGSQGANNGGQRVSPGSDSRSSPPSIWARGDMNDSPPAQGNAQTAVNARNLDLGVAANFMAISQGDAGQLGVPPRPSRLNATGTEVTIGLNAFKVTSIPTKPVYQYDVFMTDVSEKPKTEDIKGGLSDKIWNSQTVQARLQQVGPGWIYDGNKLAWCLSKTNQFSVDVDLDREKEPGRESRRTNVFRVNIRFTKPVQYNQLHGYLQGKADWDSNCLEAITSLDHIMRENPRRKLITAKRNFFPKDSKKTALGGGVEAAKGVYASLRVAYMGPKIPACLVVNADVANGTFWQELTLMEAMGQVTRAQNANDLARMFRQEMQKDATQWKKCPMYDKLKRIFRVKVITNHRVPTGEEFTVDKILNVDPPQYEFKMAEGTSGERTVNLQEYWRKTYNANAQPGFGVVQMTKKVRGNNVVFPADTLRIVPHQRFAFKLDDFQTSNMMKFAVTPPSERWKAIEESVGMLDWKKDPYLKNYGLDISPNRIETKGRLLVTPDISFANGNIPGGKAGLGRWRIDGMKFTVANAMPIKSWGVCVVQGRDSPDQQSTKAFFRSFASIYQGHGGKIANPSPVLCLGQISRGPDMIADIWNLTGKQNNTRPEILFFVMPNRDAAMYRQIKKACDTRYGVVSQCLQSKHVKMNQAQYVSNVCMKVNAKLGGSTCRANSKAMPRINPEHNKIPTMVLGADVSHPAPGMPPDTGSLAAITMSTNQDLTRFSAYVQTNGHRVEMITVRNIQAMDNYFKFWMNTIGKGKLPQRVVYLRDGLSEGQYSSCLMQEVASFKKLFNKIEPNNTAKFTVLIASKRHHVRFFPRDNADRNGNPKPGTLVETGVTNPTEFDFYLCSHAAIKGTARPVHYYCLLNEAKMTPEEIQQMCYDNSYQYCRATTPISLPPAVYYAHLASNRANAHIQTPVTATSKKEAGAKKEADPKKEAGPKKEATSSSSDKSYVDVADLAKMPTAAGIQVAMWYV